MIRRTRQHSAHTTWQPHYSSTGHIRSQLAQAMPGQLSTGHVRSHLGQATSGHTQALGTTCHHRSCRAHAPPGATSPQQLTTHSTASQHSLTAQHRSITASKHWHKFSLSSCNATDGRKARATCKSLEGKEDPGGAGQANSTSYQEAKPCVFTLCNREHLKGTALRNPTFLAGGKAAAGGCGVVFESSSFPSRRPKLPSRRLEAAQSKAEAAQSKCCFGLFLVKSTSKSTSCVKPDQLKAIIWQCGRQRRRVTGSPPEISQQQSTL